MATHPGPEQDDTASPVFLDGLIADLLDGWRAHPPAPTPQKNAWHRVQIMTVYGLAAHAHRQATAATVLLDAGMHLEAFPNVRTAYECALTAHWLMQVDGAIHDFVREMGRQERAFALSVRDTFPENPSATQLEEWAGKLLSVDSGTAGQAARHMAEMCLDLQGAGAQAYVDYRTLSGLTHPSLRILDHYLGGHTQWGADVMAVEPAVPRGDILRPLLAQALVWAGRAVDFFDPTHIRRSELRAAARTLGIPAELHPTQRVRDRQAAAQQERARRRQAERRDVERRGLRSSSSTTESGDISAPVVATSPGGDGTPPGKRDQRHRKGGKRGTKAR